MASVYIVDSGFVRTTLGGNQETTLANNGKPIILHSVEIDYSRGLNVENNPVPSLFQDKTLNIVSFDNPIITIRGVIIKGKKLDLTDDDEDPLEETTNEIDLIPILDQLVTTKGVKLLYQTEGIVTDADTGNPPTLAQLQAHHDSLFRGLIYALGTIEVTNAATSHNVSSPSTNPGKISAARRHLHVIVKGVRVRENASQSIQFDLTLEVTK